MLSYSVAIRTLGLSGETLRKELESIREQTVRPERVLVYIADGYKRPAFLVGDEEYRWVPKGMMRQRVLPYDEIGSDCILMLDDDVRLAPDSAEKLLRALEEHTADCVGADIFQNHRMSFGQKLFAAASNFIFPHRSRTWAFRMHRNGSFSYNARPEPRFYRSQSCGGPAALWRKEAFLRLHLEDELWLDDLGFPYGEDALTAYKLHANGGTLGILYGSGIENLDARSSSDRYRQRPDRFRIRSQAMLMIWWRSCYRTGADTPASRCLAAGAFGLKTLWITLGLTAYSIFRFDVRILAAHLKVLRDGWNAVHSEAFRNLRNYVF